MNDRPPGTLAVLRVLAMTSLLRFLRAAHIRRAQRLRKPGARVATPRKRGDSLLILTLAMLPLFAFQALMMTCQAVQRIGMEMLHTPRDAGTLMVDELVFDVLQDTAPGTTEHDLRTAVERAITKTDGNPPPQRIVEQFERQGLAGFEPLPKVPARSRQAVAWVGAFPWPNARAADAFAGAGALLVVVLLLVMLANAFGGANASLAGGEWTQIWLLTFPVPTRSLVLARALEYSLVQFFPWLFLLPLLLQLLRGLGQPHAFWLAAASTLLTAFLIGSLRLWAETWLRLRFSLRTLRSIQGACTLLALLLIALMFDVALADELPRWFVHLARAVPRWSSWLPAAWPLALARGHAAAVLPGVAATLLLFAVSVAACTRLLAHGAMRSAGVDPGARGRRGRWATSRRRLGVVGKDLALLLRDRNFLVQALVVPLFVIGLQLIVNPGLGHAHGKGATMLAYGIGSYALIFGCFQVLSAEGRALWILYTLPVPIAAVLQRKVRLWATTATGFAFAALLAFAAREGPLRPGSLLVDLVLVAVGLFCAAHIAAGLSILGTNPAADYVPRQTRPRHAYLYLFFAGIYLLGLRSSELAVRLPALLVFATLAFAVWQRACDRVPWLLDPVDEVRTSIGVYDAGAAVVVFFALQTLVLLIEVGTGFDAHDLSLGPQLWAFVIAGALSLLLFLTLLKLRGVALQPALGLVARTPTKAARALLLGTGCGLAAGAFALLYVHVLRTTGWLELPPSPDDRLPLLLLGVLAAPWIEEILFRGLLFQGLLRSVRPALAVVWSAAVFAAMHPMPSWIPVFVMGSCAALVFQRTRFLPAAMAVHACYNLVVVLLQP